MGRRGPPPKPTDQKRREGNPGRRPLNDLEPDYDPEEIIACPADIKGEGQREWERLMPLLVAFGTLRKTDWRTFRNYCRTVWDIEVFEADLKKIPRTLLYLKPRMYYQNMLIKLRTQARNYGHDLGLDPASRSAIKATRPKGKNGTQKPAEGHGAAKTTNIRDFIQSRPPTGTQD